MNFIFYYNKGLIFFEKILFSSRPTPLLKRLLTRESQWVSLMGLGGKLQWNPNNVENLVLNNYRLLNISYLLQQEMRTRTVSSWQSDGIQSC